MVNFEKRDDESVPRATRNDATATDGRAAARGLEQLLGLDPRAAGLAILVDLMLFGGDALTAGMLIPISLLAAGGLGLVVYRIQRVWQGDSHDTAMVKALSVAVLTAIPLPVTPFLALPAGIVGLARQLRHE